VAYEIPGFSFTLPANADLSTSQYLAAVCTSGNAAVAGAGVDIVGIIQNKPTSGKATTLVTNGVSKARAGAAVSVGAKLMTNGSGQLITATATNKGVGFALSAASAANEVISVLLKDLGTQ
jgi:hypothetical protein